MISIYLYRFSVAVAVTVASTASAYDFTSEDNLFKQRESGRVKVLAALEAYSQAQQQGDLNDMEQVYVAEQKGRLYIYYGYIVDQSNLSLRESIANQCLNSIDAIKPSRKMNASPQYYYWKAACLMARATARGIMASLSDSRLALDTINAGMDLDPSYEGGGFDRLSGVLFSNLPAWNPVGPSGDMPRALQHFRRSFDADVFNDPLFPDWKDPDTETGEYYYSGYFFYVEALKKSGNVAEARQVAQQTLARLNNGDLPRGREPEARLVKVKLEEFLRSL